MANEPAYYKRCIQQELSRRCERNPRYSLRAFAKALGFEATVISQILAGKRIPSPKTAQRLTRALDLAPDEAQQFWESLAETHRARGLERLSPFFKKHTSGAETPARELSIELFRVIADWYHYAILALTQVENFKSDPCWIASQLGISRTETSLAIERLKSLELLREEKGRLVANEGELTTADKNITNAALKRHQKQILEKSLASLENDPIERRCHRSMTMSIDSDKLPEAKRMVEDFIQKLSKFLESGKKSEVYELGVSLFPIQKRRVDS